MTKKRSSEFLGVKMEIFFEKNLIQKFWSAKKYSVPPNSAPGLRHWGRIKELSSLREAWTEEMEIYMYIIYRSWDAYQNVVRVGQIASAEGAQLQLLKARSSWRLGGLRGAS